MGMNAMPVRASPASLITFRLAVTTAASIRMLDRVDAMHDKNGRRAQLF
jgi:hypothetical protein